MINRLLLIFGMVCGVTIMLVLLYILMADFYAVLFLTRNELEISRIYALMPLLASITLLFQTTVPLLMLGKFHYAVSLRERCVRRNIIVYLSIFTVVLFFTVRPMLDMYLVANSYEYERTVDTKKPFDVDVYVQRINEHMPLRPD
ncbi:hypothetical protein [Vibrio sinaloensis]|nr:hypothetical protein [Vibrio sinaloensis]KHT47733.1 hypothetical protein RJ47_02580 [Vibrio sinaloensis]